MIVSLYFELTIFISPIILSVQYSISYRTMLFEQPEQQLNLNFQNKKIIHMIDLQVMDIQSTLHYIQKKHSPHQLKQAFSQIYNIFNELQPVFQHIKAMFLNKIIKKLTNCFGIIYLIQTQHSDHRSKDLTLYSYDQITSQSIESRVPRIKQTLNTEQSNDKCSISNHRPLGGIYLYNQSYQRNINICAEKKQKKTVQKKTTMDKQEFTKAVMDQINDRSLSIPHPDEMLDLFAFKFKYGKKNQIVTFHDQLESIAKYFKDAQNDAYQFLNKCKGQRIQFQYNESFKDIMTMVKIQKQTKLKEFTSKVSGVFKNIKKKTQYHMNQIQARLQQVEIIKNTYLPPQKADQSTQTSNTYEQQLKYIKRKYQDSQQKYNLMAEIKKKEIQQAALNEIALQNQVTMKARQIVYLKLSLQQNKLNIKNLNRKIKTLIQSQRQMKQKVVRQIREKNQQSKLIPKVQILDCLNEIHSIQSFQNEDDAALESLKKQKQMAKRMIFEARRDSLDVSKSNFSKRFTQQQGIQLSRIGSARLLNKWTLSQISQNDSEKQEKVSNSSNKNNLLTQKKINTGTQNKINMRVFQEEEQKIKRQPSINSIKSTLGQLKKKNTRKNTSHFIELERKASFHQSNFRPSEIYEDSIFNDSEYQDQNNSSNQSNIEEMISKEEMNRIQQMYQRQINKVKSQVNNKKKRITTQGPSTGTNSYFGHQRANQSSRFQSSKRINARNSLFSNSSVSQIRNFFNQEVRQMRQTQEDEDSRQKENIDNTIFNRINQLQTEILSLKKQLQCKKQKRQLKIVPIEVQLYIEPSYKHILQVRNPSKTIKHVEIISGKMRNEIDKQTDYSDIKTKYIQLQSVKDKKGSRRQHNRLVTQIAHKQILASRSNLKNKFTSQHVKRHSGKLKTNFFKKTEKTNQEEKYKTQQAYSNIHENTDTPKINYPCFQSNSTPNCQQQISKKNDNGKFPSNSTHIQSENIMKNNQSNIEFLTHIQEEKIVKQIAVKSKNIKQFKRSINQLHKKRCGLNCSHLQQYFSNFAKYRQQNKIKMKMHIQNVHQFIESQADNTRQLPKLGKQK